MKNCFFHHLHGEQLHDLVIYFIQYHVTEKGAQLKDTAVYKKRYYWPCEPDVIFTFVDKGKPYTYVIEVETDATKKSIETKNHQYKDTMAGLTDLIILNLGELDKKTVRDWMKLKKWIVGRLPI